MISSIGSRAVSMHVCSCGMPLGNAKYGDL